MRTHYCGKVTAADLDQNVTLCGWVHRRRDHGGVIFIDLRDREGLVQVVCDPDRPDMFHVAESIRNEFVIKLTGKVRRRPSGTENANLVSGEIEAGERGAGAPVRTGETETALELTGFLGLSRTQGQGRSG